MSVDCFSLVTLAYLFFLDMLMIWLGTHMILNRRRTEHVVEGLVLLAMSLTGFYYLCNFARPYVAFLLAGK